LDQSARNPDGTYFGGDETVADAIRYYVDETGQYSTVDANRDFPEPDGANGEGRIETRAMVALAEREPFVLSANLHGGAEVVNFPWDHTSRRHVDDAWWRALGRRYADRAQEDGPAGYMEISIMA